METKANYTLIGAFTLGIIAAAFAFVFWFSGSKSAQRSTYEVIFTGSVSGLSRGSQVLYNGLRVGEVISIDIMEDDPSKVDALISVVGRAKITTDTRARLELQGLTGVAAIALTGGSASAEYLRPPQGRSYPVIFAERSDLQNLLETVQRLTTKADAVLEKADALLGTNTASVSQSVHNAEVFSKALADNAPGVNTFLSSMSEVGRVLQPLSVQLSALSGDLDLLVKSVEPDRVRATVANAEAFSGVLVKNGSNFDGLLENAAAAAKSLNASTSKLDVLLAQVGNIVKGVEIEKLTAAIDGVARVTNSGAKVLEAVDPGQVKTLVASADTFAAALAKSAPGLEGLVADAAGTARQLNAASGKLDSVLAGADSTLKAIDAAKLRTALDDLAKLAASGAQVAAAVDPAQVRTIIEGAGGFARVLANNQAKIDTLFVDAAGIARQLNASSSKFDSVLASADATLKAVDATKLRAALDDLAKLAASGAQVAAAIDPARVRSLVDNAGGFSDVLAKNQGTIDNLLADAGIAAKNLGASSGKLDGVLTGVSDVMKGLDAVKIASAVDNVARFTQTLDANRGSVETALRDAGELAAKLNASADKIDGVLKGLDGFLGGNTNSKGMFADITEAARSIRKLADNLDGRTKEITAGINRFTGPGFREYEALASDGRRTLNDLNRAVRSLERNPSQLLFGGKPAIPEYKGGQ